MHTHLDRARDPLIVSHPVYQALGSDPASRAVAYRAWLDAPIDAGEVARIRAYLTQEKGLGEPRFQAMVEKALNRPVALRPRGRPRAKLPAGGAGG